MNEPENNKNEVWLIGAISKRPEIKDAYMGCKRYVMELEICQYSSRMKSERRSKNFKDKFDYVPVMLTDCEAEGILSDKKAYGAKVTGHIKQWNTEDHHSMIVIAASSVSIIHKNEELIDMNFVDVEGHVCRFYTERQSRNGVLIKTFCIALNYAGEKSDYISCVAFGNDAGLLSKYAKIGTLVNIQGVLRSKYIEPKEGEASGRMAHEIICREITFAD